MKFVVKPGADRTVLLPPQLGGQTVPAEGMEVDGDDLFIVRRLEDGDLVKVDSGASSPRASNPRGE